jgi:membrane protein implicated in regulation of membrane protease activity
MLEKILNMFKPKPGDSVFFKRLVGKKARVIEDINPTGKIRFGRSWWVARSHSGDAISKGERVEIVNVKGFMAVVKK